MENIIQAFSDTRKWAKVLGIVFIVSFVLNLLSLSILSIIIAVATNLVPGILLLRYSGHVKDIEEANSPALDEIESACIAQGKFFRYMGIMAIVMVVVAIIGIIAAIAIPSYIAAGL